MKLLLDTHTFIWWDTDSSKLSSTAFDLIKDEKDEHEIYQVWSVYGK